MFNEHAILNELNPLLREKVINYNCRSLVKVRFHWSSAFSCLWFVHQWKLWKVCWFFECCWHWFRFRSDCKAQVWSLFASWWDYPWRISRKPHVLYQLWNSSSYDEKWNETKISIRYPQSSIQMSFLAMCHGNTPTYDLKIRHFRGRAFWWNLSFRQ